MLKTKKPTIAPRNNPKQMTTMKQLPKITSTTQKVQTIPSVITSETKTLINPETLLSRSYSIDETPIPTVAPRTTRTPSPFPLSSYPTEATLDLSSGDYVVYGLLPNKTLVRRVPSRTTTPPSELPFVVYGLYPNGTIVKRFPNGTVIPDDPPPQEANELVANVDPFNKQELSDIVERDRPLAYLYPTYSTLTTMTPTTEMVTTTTEMVKTTTSTSVKTTTTKKQSPSTRTTTVKPTTKAPAKISTKKPTPSTITTENPTKKPSPSTTTTTEKPTTKPSTKPPTKKPSPSTTTTTEKPTTKTPTKPSPSTTTTTEKPTTKTPTKPPTKKPSNSITTTTKATIKKPIISTTTTKTTVKPTTTTFKPTPKLSSVTMTTTKKPKTTTIKLTTTTTKKPITTTKTTTTETPNIASISTKSTADTVDLTRDSGFKTTDTINSQSRITEDFALLNTLLQLQNEQSGNSIATPYVTPDASVDDDDLANRIIQLAIERAQSSTEMPTSQTPEVVEIKSSPEFTPSGGSAETPSTGGKISLWVVPEEKPSSPKAPELTPQEEQVLNALLTSQRGSTPASIRDQILLAELLGGLPSTTKRPQKKKKKPRASTTARPPPLSGLAAIISGLGSGNQGGGGQGGLFGGSNPAQASDQDSFDEEQPRNPGLLVTAAINITKAVSQFMGIVLQGAAQSFQNFVQTRTRTLADYLTNGSRPNGG